MPEEFDRFIFIYLCALQFLKIRIAVQKTYKTVKKIDTRSCKKNRASSGYKKDYVLQPKLNLSHIYSSTKIRHTTSLGKRERHTGNRAKQELYVRAARRKVDLNEGIENSAKGISHDKELKNPIWQTGARKVQSIRL